jgi:hypothetical protein
MVGLARGGEMPAAAKKKAGSLFLSGPFHHQRIGISRLNLEAPGATIAISPH